MNLLEPQAFTLRDKVINMAILFAFKFVWVTFIVAFLKGVIFIDAISRPDLFFIVLIGPMVEELQYRWAPITFAKYLGKEYILPIIVLSSIIFGYDHGNGLVSLLIQGVGGFAYCILYIRNNYSYWSCVAVHSTWNLFTFL